MDPLRFGRGPGQFVFALFGEAAPERVVGVFPDFGIARRFFDFGADELVFAVVLEILVFTVGELAVNQVAQSVVGVFGAVMFLQPVADVQVGVGRGFQTACGCGGRMVGRQDIAGRVKGEPFDTAAAVFRLPDAAEFVVDILQRAAAPVFAPDQVARSVVGVAAADRADLHVLFAALSEGMGLLPFQTAYRIVFVYAADMSLGLEASIKLDLPTVFLISKFNGILYLFAIAIDWSKIPLIKGFLLNAPLKII